MVSPDRGCLGTRPEGWRVVSAGNGSVRVTPSGLANWERLVALAACPASDVGASQKIADSLAALVAEVTPRHREVLASQYLTRGVPGRMQHWRVPPGLEGDEGERRRWAAVVLIDAVCGVADASAEGYSLPERLAWVEAARAYTGGAENAPAG